MLIQNMSQLQRLDCGYGSLNVDGVRALQPALQVNRTLKELNLWSCYIRDEGIHVIADALKTAARNNNNNNTSRNCGIEILNVGGNGITSTGLFHITKILESTRLKTINLALNSTLFSDAVSTRQFALVVTRHKFLKNLNLSCCRLQNDGLHIIADSLVGNNTIMEVLDISINFITSVGLPDITRLLESMQLKTINISGNRGIFDNPVATQHFVTTLQHKNATVQELPEIYPENFSIVNRAATYALVNNSLIRNHQLNLVNSLLDPLQQRHRNNNTSIMMLKIAHKAIVKFAMVNSPNNNATGGGGLGASAIFKLFQARPLLLEKRLKRPTNVG